MDKTMRNFRFDVIQTSVILLCAIPFAYWIIWMLEFMCELLGMTFSEIVKW